MLFHKELLIPFNCKLYLSNPFVKINMMSGLGTWSLLVDKLFVSQTCYFFVSYQIICTVGTVHDSQREMKKFAENSLIIIPYFLFISSDCFFIFVQDGFWGEVTCDLFIYLFCEPLCVTEVPASLPGRKFAVTLKWQTVAYKNY